MGRQNGQCISTGGSNKYVKNDIIYSGEKKQTPDWRIYKVPLTLLKSWIYFKMSIILKNVQLMRLFVLFRFPYRLHSFHGVYPQVLNLLQNTDYFKVNFV